MKEKTTDRVTSTTNKATAKRTSRAAEFRALLGTRILTADGAMATELFKKGIGVNRCLEELNLSLPAVVRDVHREAVRAGAEILETNTFGANRARLGMRGFEKLVGPINHAAVKIARAAAGSAFVAGAMGPVGHANGDEIAAAFREQASALAAAGVDLIILETFQDLNELRQAVLMVREAAGEEMVIVAQIAVNGDSPLPGGTTPAAAAVEIDKLPVDAIGVNCGSGPRSAYLALEQMSRATSKPLSAFPAGAGSPEYLAAYAKKFAELGAVIVGGCCMTDPKHIAAMKAALTGLAPANREAPPPFEILTRKASEPAPLERRSLLGSRLQAGKFTILAEATPSTTLLGDRVVVPEDVHAVTVEARCGISLCQRARKSTGLEPVLIGGLREGSPQDLAAAFLAGIRNIVVQGPEAVQLAALADRINRGLEGDVDPDEGLVIGVGCFGGSENDWEDVAEAAGNGASFLMTQPVFSAEQVGKVVDRAAPLGLPVIVTIRLLLTDDEAEFAREELHLDVPPGTPTGLAATEELLKNIRERVAGVRLVAPGHLEAVAALSRARRG